MFGVLDTATDYGKHESTANSCGYTAAFWDEEGCLRTVVMIRRAVKNYEHKGLKYVLKIPALLHQLGHVHDIENRLFFNVDTEEVVLIEAEVLANLLSGFTQRMQQLISYVQQSGETGLARAFRTELQELDFIPQSMRHALTQQGVDWNGGKPRSVQTPNARPAPGGQGRVYPLGTLSRGSQMR